MEIADRAARKMPRNFYQSREDSELAWQLGKEVYLCPFMHE